MGRSVLSTCFKLNDIRAHIAHRRSIHQPDKKQAVDLRQTHVSLIAERLRKWHHGEYCCEHAFILTALRHT